MEFLTNILESVKELIKPALDFIPSPVRKTCAFVWDVVTGIAGLTLAFVNPLASIALLFTVLTVNTITGRYTPGAKSYLQWVVDVFGDSGVITRLMKVICVVIGAGIVVYFESIYNIAKTMADEANESRQERSRSRLA